ncbi:MAG: peptide chain release factor N(5)-glutamine methyltransferase [Spirochaetia bacterium]|nr:peptide chain release factor N(5)-glutamine methyltransferase [Sphaerochaeta sp.]NCC11809.1 peptide chain release factor N(5)-glutamine methyltransferase [Spirochaetia bacterium]
MGGMTVQQWKRSTASRLMDGSVDQSPDLDARLLLQNVTGLDHVQQILCSDQELTEEELSALETLVLQRLAHRPMAYILGSREFYGRDFHVDERVLIPRPDTEILVEQVLAFAGKLNKSKDLSIIDVCTGSGAIGITLALELGCQVTLTDISAAALEVAKANAERLGAKVTMLQGDLLSPAEGKYDIIVSNPPYLTQLWCDQVSKEVAWEPRLALDGREEDGLGLIRTLVQQSTEHLDQGGALFLECDYRQAPGVATLLGEHQFAEVGTARDLAFLERVVWGVLACTSS